MNRTRNIGILGAGQLARMTALSGLPLGARFAVYDTSGQPSAGIGDIFVDAGNTQRQLDDFLDSSDVVTYEFEHLPLDLAEAVAARRPLYPNVRSLAVCQDREKEKSLFARLGIPTAPWRIARSLAELKQAVEELGTPAVVKSATMGYDGKGQTVIRDPAGCAEAWSVIGHDRLLVESFVAFRREISIIAARSVSGEIAVYPLAENIHVEGILRYSLAAAPALRSDFEDRARQHIETLMNELDYVGILALELFETDDGLVANEMAPRVHNSGHWTMNGAETSQFENHLRAIMDLPLGSTSMIRPTCMVNLIGHDINLHAVAALPGCHIHLYDKVPRPGRKIGHINVCGEQASQVHERVQALLSVLPPMPCYPFASAPGPD